MGRKPLRTYSRRAPRRMTSPPVPAIDHKLRLTKSFTAATNPPKTTDENAQQPEFPVPGPKRVRLSAPEQSQKSPTDLFFRMINSSAPELIQPQDDDQLEEVVLLSTEKDDDDLGDDEDSPDELLGLAGGDTECEACRSQELAVKEELEESFLKTEDDGDSDVLNRSSAFNEQVNDLVESSPRSSAWPSFPPTRRLAHTTPKPKGRFLTFKKADDREDFKSVEKRPESQTSGSLNLKISRPINDGFEDDEKHTSAYRKQRRINNHNNARLGRLELTQKGTFTQKLQSPSWPRGQKKSRTATITSLWAGRQYLGNSQINTGSQDPLESFGDETEPYPQIEPKGRRQEAPHFNQDELNDADEEVDLLVFPPDDVNYDDVGAAYQDIDEVDLLVETDKLSEEQTHVACDNDKDVDFLVIPKTDTPEPEQNAALGSRTGF